MAKKKILPQEWTTDDRTAYWTVSIPETMKKVPAGAYLSAFSNKHGPILAKMDIMTDGLVQFEDAQTKRLAQEFTSFWTLKDKYRQAGFLHKRGYLLWGPPGSGKTSLINLLMHKTVEELDGIVMFIKSIQSAPNVLMQAIRRVEPDRPLFIIMEDLDSLIHRNESEFLSILDGSSQIDGVVFVATTNYPENLSPRLLDRPNRFDRIEHINMPSVAQRRHFLKLKADGLSEIELKKWAQATVGLSIAHLRELIVSVQCLGQNFDEVVARLKKMHEFLPSSEQMERKVVGFTRNGENDEDDDWIVEDSPEEEVA